MNDASELISGPVLVVGCNKEDVHAAVARLDPLTQTAVEGTALSRILRLWRRDAIHRRIASRLGRHIVSRSLKPPSGPILLARSLAAVMSRVHPQLVVALDGPSADAVFLAIAEAPDVVAVLSVDVAHRLLTGDAVVDAPKQKRAVPPSWQSALPNDGCTTTYRMLIGGRDLDGANTAIALAARTLPCVDARSVASAEVGSRLFSPADVDAETGIALARDATHVLWHWESGVEFSALMLAAGSGLPRARIGFILTARDLIDPADHADRYVGSVYRHSTSTSTALNEKAPRWRLPAIGSDRVDSQFFVCEDWLADLTGLPLLTVPVPRLVPPKPPGSSSIPAVVSWSALADTPVHDVLESMATTGAIRHHRIEEIPPSMRAHVVSAADVVVDRIGVGGLGWASRMGMAAGRVVCISGVGVSPDAPALRPNDVSAALDGTGWFSDMFRGVVDDLAAKSGEALEIAARGPAYADDKWSIEECATRVQAWLEPVNES